MLLKFILAETHRAVYYLLTRGPLSQALSENVHLCMSRCIFTYKAVKMNTLVTNSSVEHFARHQKNQCFGLPNQEKQDSEYNCTVFIVH